MNTLKELEVIIPSYHSKELTSIIVQSFEKFKPEDMSLLFHIVENSDDVSYKEESLGWAENVIWYNNPEADKVIPKHPYGKGTWANASAIQFVKDKIKSDFVFVCHNDCIVTDQLFFEEMKDKIEEGYEIISTITTSVERRLAHSAGTLVRSEVLKKAGAMPVPEKNLDVLEVLTDYADTNSIEVYIMDNTFNDKTLFAHCDGVWKDLGPNCGVDRVLDSGRSKVVFAHLGRGSDKVFNRYHKQGKVQHSGWVAVCKALLEKET